MPGKRWKVGWGCQELGGQGVRSVWVSGDRVPFEQMEALEMGSGVRTDTRPVLNASELYA